MLIGQANYPSQRTAWTVWGLGAALYFVAFYLRVAPAVLTNELTIDFALTAAALGNLSAFYFYSYVAMQIPTGILADTLGPRKLLTIGCAVAALGTMVFAVAPTVWWANFGRLLIGASVGVAFVAMLKLASRWMPPRQFALTSGVALATGVLGAVCAGVPLRWLVDAFGWRITMMGSAALTLLLAFATWIVVRDDPSERGYISYADVKSTHKVSGDSLFKGISKVLTYKNTWLLFLIPGCMPALVLSFAGLWGVPFLTTHYNKTPAQAATLCSFMMIAWAVGSLCFGAASDRLGQRKPLFLAGIVCSSLLFAVLIYMPHLPMFWLWAVIGAAGFCAGCFIVTFAFAKESVPVAYAGTVSGVSNMGVIQGPMYTQPLVGWLLDISNDATVFTLVGGASRRVFSFIAYQNAFRWILLWCAISFVLLLFTRETYCKQLAAE
jgi:MFS family permease